MKNVISGAIATAIGMACYNSVTKEIERVIKVENNNFISTAWVISPSGKLIAEFSYNTAFRIYRKRQKQGWNFSTIKPYTPYWKRLFKIVKVIPFKQVSPEALNSIISLTPILTYIGIMAGAAGKLSAGVRKD